jgi:hypothetical protein
MPVRIVSIPTASQTGCEAYCEAEWGRGGANSSDNLSVTFYALNPEKGNGN